jgi:nucleoside-diphosphate-sugar epimerase
MSGRIAVLGAGGYLGQALVPALLAGGNQVRGLGRRLPPDWPAGTAFQLCDATDARALLRAITDCDGAINAMAGPPWQMLRVATAIADCRAQGWAGRLVHISSLAVFGQAAGTFDEAATPVPAAGHDYAHAKLAAEKLLAGPATAILRPGCIYGDAAPVWVDRLCRLLLSRRLGWLWDEGAGHCQLMHVRDVARCAVSALAGGAQAAGVHHLTCHEDLTWNTYIQHLAQALGIAALPRISSLRLDIETYVHGPVRAAASRLGFPDAGPITPAMRRLFHTQARVTATRAPLVAPADRVGLQAGIEAAVADFRRRVPFKLTRRHSLYVPHPTGAQQDAVA